MKLASIKKFVKLWNQEHQLCVDMQELDTEIERAQRRDQPHKLMANRYAKMEAKIGKISSKIATGIESGEFPQELPNEAWDALGDLGGYVADCYATYF